MGLAIIVPNADYSSNNIGRVNFIEEKHIESLQVTNTEQSGNYIQFSPIYTPSDTTELGVTWSITSGSQYAEINANTGRLKVKVGASANQVTVRATSLVMPSIYAEKTVLVSRVQEIVPIQYLRTNGWNYIDTGIVPSAGFGIEIIVETVGNFTGRTFICGECGYQIGNTFGSVYCIAGLSNNGTSSASFLYSHRNPNGNLVPNIKVFGKYKISLGDKGLKVEQNGETLIEKELTLPEISYNAQHANYYIHNLNIIKKGSGVTEFEVGPQENVDAIRIFDVKLIKTENGVDTTLLHLVPVLADEVPAWKADDGTLYFFQKPEGKLLSPIMYRTDAESEEQIYTA